jgi:hypothetical protein
LGIRIGENMELIDIKDSEKSAMETIKNKVWYDDGIRFVVARNVLFSIEILGYYQNIDKACMEKERLYGYIMMVTK